MLPMRVTQPLADGGGEHAARCGTPTLRQHLDSSSGVRVRDRLVPTMALI
jgi:hypothetical protein